MKFKLNNGNKECFAFGRVWLDGVPQEIDDPHAISKLTNHRHFEVVHDEAGAGQAGAAETPRPRRGRKPNAKG
jgi:hypothetical protein